MNKMTEILIADDNLMTVKELFNGLYTANKKIKLIGIASNGIETMNYLEKYTPDILLLDLSMPKMSGFQVLDKMLQAGQKYFSKTKIIIVSSYIDKLDNRFRNYLYATISKPYNIDKILYCINSIMSEKENNNIERYVNTELERFEFNRNTKAYKYLKSAITEVIENNYQEFNLERDIYEKLVKRYRVANAKNIKWEIDKLITKMYINTKVEIVQWKLYKYNIQKYMLRL